MTTTTAYAQLAEQGAGRRGGANLLAQRFHDPIPDAAFKAQSDGTVLVTGIDLLKSGTFFGMFGSISLVDGDLDAMVGHFDALVGGGVFVPPFRLDHSWSVESVIGWFEKLETYRRVDPLDSLEKTFLRGDVRITGSITLQPAQIVDAIKRGALRNRSSELGTYYTNAGVEIPLAFYGCAYVDIPAVEGLEPVSLSRRPEPNSIVTLSADAPQTPPKGTGTMTQQQTGAPSTATTTGPATPAQPDAAPGDGGNANAGGTTSPAADTEVVDGVVDKDGNQVAPPPAGAEAAAPTVVEPVASGTAAPVADTELAQLRQELADMRATRARDDLAAFSAAGVVTDANRDAVTALLSYNDEAVRSAARTVLGNTPAGVALGQRRGQQGPTAGTSLAVGTGTSTAASGGELITLGMSKDEAMDRWTSLSPADRKLRQPEYDAWREHRAETGVRD